MQEEHLVNVARLVLLRAAILRIISLTMNHFGQLLQFESHVVHRWLLQELLTSSVGRRRARLHPSVHLSDQKVEALLRVGFVVEDKLTLHVVELE